MLKFIGSMILIIGISLMQGCTSVSHDGAKNFYGINFNIPNRSETTSDFNHAPLPPLVDALPS